MAYLQAYQRKMIRIVNVSDPNRKRTKAPPLNHHMTLRSRGIRGHVYEMRNHKLNSPKTRRFAFTNIVSVTKDFQTPRSIIRRPFLILKTIFLVGLSWHIYRVLYFTEIVLWSSNEKLEWHHFNTMQPKTVTVAQVKMMEHKCDFDPFLGSSQTIFCRSFALYYWITLNIRNHLPHN